MPRAILNETMRIITFVTNPIIRAVWISVIPPKIIPFKKLPNARKTINNGIKDNQ